MKQPHPIPALDGMVLSFDLTFTLALAADSEGGYLITCPELPGFAASGRSLEEAGQAVRFGITEHLCLHEQADTRCQL